MRAQHPSHAGAILDVAHGADDSEPRVVRRELLLDRVERVLVQFEQDEQTTA
jgi:hypothetical protein